MANIDLADIDIVATAWDSSRDPSNGRMRLADEQLRTSSLLGALRTNAKWYAFDHHQCHAVAAYFCARMQTPAIVLVMDGRGETCSTSAHMVSGSHIETLATSSLVASIGTFYGAATEYCGFGYGGQGKTMGLAPYGQPTFEFAEFRSSGFGVTVDWARSMIRSDDLTSSHRRVYEAWKARFRQVFGPAREFQPRLDARSLNMEPNSGFDQRHADAAASAQSTVERLVGQLVGNLSESYPGVPIVVAGGVALNCAANGRLRTMYGDVSLHFLPIPHDAGTSMGAALMAARAQNQDLVLDFQPYLGTGWTDAEITAILATLGLSYSEPADLPEAVAQLIMDGRVVAWFQGRAEVGPRALGHRSILANAYDVDTKLRLNTGLKYRESWRPFGPSVLQSDMKDLFGVSHSPFMIEAFELEPSYRGSLAAVCHVDGTSRPHSVEQGVTSERYVGLLESIRQTTGTGVVLNTSFNVGAEPIVYSPVDAIRTFYASAVDALAIGPFILRKSSSR